jgi:hypothetical protein
MNMPQVEKRSDTRSDTICEKTEGRVADFAASFHDMTESAVP